MNTFTITPLRQVRLAAIIFITLAWIVRADDVPHTIRLSPAINVTGTADGLECKIELTNRGTESVHRLRWHAEFAGVPQVWEDADTRLEPGTNLEVTHPLRTPSPLTEGEYPFILTTTFRDRSGYPFSSILATTVTNLLPAASAPAPLRILVYPPERLKHRGDLRVVAISEHAEPLNARIRLVTPHELETTTAEQLIEIPAKSAHSIRFPIHNIRGRAGRRITVSAVITYELDARPRCLVRSTTIEIPPHRGYLARYPMFWIAIATMLLLLFALCQWPGIAKRVPRTIGWIGSGWTIGLFMIILLTAHIPLDLLLRDTLTVGGDTPAHNYLASHLRTHWFGEGRLLTWSHAWWSGFPAFQFYFPLPYMLIALLSLLAPFNLAFKITSILGIVLLPFSVWLTARVLKFPKSVAALMTAAMFPFLFTDAHVMWGVNLYSTLAGMIASSLSFALFPLCLACAWRDAETGRPRIHTALFLAALILSHFFTSIIACLTIACMPFVQSRSSRRQALTALFCDGIPAVLLSAWWLFPLLAKQAYSVDFGDNWDVTLWRTLPWEAYLAVLPAAVAIGFACHQRHAAIRPWIWMTAAATVLFVIGTALHPVFVNIRLWPFIYFGILILAAIGSGFIIERFQCPFLAVLAIFLYMAIAVDNAGSLVRSWAEWNLEGLEAKPLATEFHELIEPLDGTPGRLAYDLNDANKAFGSSRIFEAVPHIIDKPILEGGLVNSALGALFAYTVQGEISERGAGYPAIVPPSDFNPQLGLRHLDLFNVRHLITAWEPLHEVLMADDGWKPDHQVDRWTVFSATSSNSGKIGVLDDLPIAVDTVDFQSAAVAWMQTPALLDQPFVWLRPRTAPPPGTRKIISQSDYEALVHDASLSKAGSRGLFSFDSDPVTLEEWTDHRIRFRTTAVGRPHMIKTSYFPNWRVRGPGASEVYMISPAFMLVIPSSDTVELVYGFTAADRMGHLATLAGILALIGAGIKRRLPRDRKKWRERKPSGVLKPHKP